MRKRSAFLIALLVMLAGCRADAALELRLNSDSKGTVSATVTLDRDAVRRAGDNLGVIRTDDLLPAGWTFERKVLDGGSTSFIFARRVNSALEAQSALRQFGPPFADLRVVHKKSLIKKTTTVSGTVDLQKGLDEFSDPALRKSLGRTIDDLFDLSAISETERRPIAITMRLTGNGTDTVQLPLDTKTVVDLSASSWRLDWIYVVLGAGCVLWAAWLYRPRRRRPAHLAKNSDEAPIDVKPFGRSVPARRASHRSE